MHLAFMNYCTNDIYIMKMLDGVFDKALEKVGTITNQQKQ
jgi:hypothetical protein